MKKITPSEDDELYRKRRVAGELRGAHASRVLAKASRLGGLFTRVVTDFVHLIYSDAAGKFVSAGRRNQHARRVRSPE